MTEVERLTGLRAHFARLGDRGLVAEVDAQLARMGVTPETHVIPLAEAAVPTLERRGPGRPRTRKADL